MTRFPSNLIRFAALSFLIQWSGCAAHQAAVAVPSDTVRATAIVEDNEREILRALVHKHHAGKKDLLAADFTCSVVGSHPFTLNRTAARFSVCAGMGHDLSARAEQSEVVQQFENRAPRVGEIVSMETTARDGAIVVVSTQAYQHWMPYDGPYERRSRLTDTWEVRDGEWQLVRRISEPLQVDTRGRS
jgi:hypothetical protein